MGGWGGMGCAVERGMSNTETQAERTTRVTRTRTLAGVARRTIECATSESRTVYRVMGPLLETARAARASVVGGPGDYRTAAYYRGEEVRTHVEQALMM